MLFNHDLKMKISALLRSIIRYFSLESEIDEYDKVHDEIVKGVIFRGTNLWILVFAIIVCSVGLNMNSTAVVIGAMLISPLMGPINGIGYSISTYDSALFKKSLRNFSFSVFASIAASTIYFFVSPVSAAHSELLARTSPTIWDVVIALFGGLAGIVAISSKQKGNVIPGVAIATALMPPLCTAGYGIATAQFNFFFGAFYLFTINSVFIAIATFFTSQLLGFPIRGLVEDEHKKNINRWISLVMIVVLLPSIYFGYQLVQKEKFVEKANQYVASVSMVEGNYLLKSDIDANKREITLIYGGLNLPEERKKEIIEIAKHYQLEKAKVRIMQGLAFTNFNDKKDAEVVGLRKDLSFMELSLNKKQLELDSIKQIGHEGRKLLNEIHEIYPEINGCSYAESNFYVDSSSNPIPTAVILFTLKEKRISVKDKEKIGNWVKKRIDKKHIIVMYK